jgi:hypothetical protein
MSLVTAPQRLSLGTHYHLRTLYLLSELLLTRFSKVILAHMSKGKVKI